MPDLKASFALHCAKDLACQLGWPKEETENYQYEYLFEWKIPGCLVILRITMATLLRRGFNMRQLCGHTTFVDFPDMFESRTLIRDHWKSLCLFDKGFKAGLAGGSFGYHPLTGRLADDFLGLTCARNPFGPVKEGLEAALDSHASGIGDGLMEYKCELEDLSETAAFLDDEYAAKVEEMMWDLSDEPAAVEDALILLKEQHRKHQAMLEKRLADIHLCIGY
jgi:hypothetical protein